MRRHRHERLETVALVLALLVLVLAGILYRVSAPKVDLVEESRPFYTYRVIGGLEEDVGHIIEREINHE